MKVQNWLDWIFSWRGRTCRAEFIIRILTSWLLAWFLAALITMIEPDYARLVAVAAGCYFYFCSAIRRSHDMGKSGTFALLLLVPFVFVYPLYILIFKNGDKDANKYGKPDVFWENKWLEGIHPWRIVIFVSTPILHMIISIVIMLAMHAPYQQDYNGTFTNLGVALFFPLVFFTAPMLILAILPSLWYFILKRLSEISAAIRGTQNYK